MSGEPDPRGTVGDPGLVDALVQRAAVLRADDPAAAVDVLRAAVRLAGSADRPAMRLQLAAAHMAAAQCETGEELLGSVLHDTSAPVLTRRDAALALLVRQLAQLRLAVAATTIGVLVSLPMPMDADEQELLVLLCDAISATGDHDRLRELNRVARGPRRRGTALPDFVALFLASQVNATYGALGPATEQLEQAVGLAPPNQAGALRLQLALLLLPDRPAEAAELLTGLRETTSADLRLAAAVGDLFASVCRGDWTHARGIHARLGTTLPRDGLIASFHAYVASIVARARGDADLAAQVEAMAARRIDADDWLSRNNLLLARANAASARGADPLAIALLVDAIASLERSGAVGLTIKLAGRVGTLLDGGRRDCALRLGALIDELTERHPSEVHLMYRTWKDALLDDDPDRQLAVMRAVGVSAVRVDAAEMHERAGAALLRAGRTAEAVTALRAASDEHAAAGAWAAVSRVRATLRARGFHLHATRDADALLSHTESAVADLARRGFTNAAIARRLGMSVGTVSTHLSRVYRKLDVSSRVELVAALGAVAT